MSLLSGQETENRNYRPYKKYRQDSLQTQKISFTPMNGYIRALKVRMSLFASFWEKKWKKRISKASMTVEAAVVLPMFVFAMFAVIYFIEIIRLQTEIESVLCQTGREIAEYAYVTESLTSGNGDDSGGILKKTASSMMAGAYVKGKLISELGKDYLDGSCIVGGSNGIKLWRSVFVGKDEEVDLVAEYEIKIPFFSFGVPGIRIVQRARTRAWTGYKVREDSGKQEEIVYITETGSVYHRNPDCTHLKLSIRQVSEAAVSGLRNADSGRYSCCPLCKNADHVPGLVYITDQGGCYHMSLDCSGLKRSIMAVPISEVGGRPPCSRCGR